MYSHIDGNHMFHTDFYGIDVGRSFTNYGDQNLGSLYTNKHFDMRDHLVAWDEVDEKEGVARHYEEGELIGSTSLSQVESSGTIIADEQLIEAIDEFNRSYIMSNEQTRNLLDKWLESRRNCLDSMSLEACVQAKYDSLEYLDALMSNRR